MRPWTHSAEAAALLASCAASPPQRRLFSYRFQETEVRFVGRRVQRLRSLYRCSEPRVDDPAWRAWLDVDPQRAIAQAIAAHSAVPEPPPSGESQCPTAAKMPCAATTG